MNRFSIKDIEILTGIKPHTIRIWEQRYGIIKPQRTATNIRYYTENDLKLMLNVSLLNKMGFKISKITCLKPNEIEHKVLSLVEQANDADINLSALLNCMVRLDEDTFEHLLNKYLETNGLETTMTRILFPFLYRIGLLWQTGSITPAYEHFFTNLVRQKIIAAIDKQVLTPLPDAKRFLLFLPPNEPHELGLLYAHYVIRQRGHRSVYMGLNLPIDHIICAHECCQPDFIVTTLTSCIKINAIEEFIVQISKTFSKSKILLSGAQAVNKSLHLPQNVQIISDFDDFIQYIENRVN
ncbi:MAG TPA: MerR family transcriptional regulator [Bacteroidia bacterium]|nr:MerR family transcriptional regulator [Bacteroidia bacterium]MCW5918663.1 MerR family transcriptional regulator [Bacteroidota bacterium]HRC91440.1 MerR family transcriptional regulator [Bacteroidia bacterium]HRH83339.1 MerR family transcriptional regulator [Bacteroidia bacterium]HRS09390.1 MerR family transcriptional regulator [Bacteroidia bacterium]